MALKVTVLFEDLGDEDYDDLMGALNDFGAINIEDETVPDDPDNQPRRAHKKPKKETS